MEVEAAPPRPVHEDRWTGVVRCECHRQRTMVYGDYHANLPGMGDRLSGAGCAATDRGTTVGAGARTHPLALEVQVDGSRVPARKAPRPAKLSPGCLSIAGVDGGGLCASPSPHPDGSGCAALDVLYLWTGQRQSFLLVDGLRHEIGAWWRLSLEGGRPTAGGTRWYVDESEAGMHPPLIAHKDFLGALATGFPASERFDGGPLTGVSAAAATLWTTLGVTLVEMMISLVACGLRICRRRSGRSSA